MKWGWNRARPFPGRKVFQVKARIQKRLRNYKRRIQYRLRKKQWDEQRHPMFQDQNIHYDIAAKSKGLTGAGLGDIELLGQRVGLPEALIARLPRHKRH